VPVVKLYFRGVFSPVGVALSALLNLVALSEYTRGSDYWMWLFFGAVALLGSSLVAYWRAIQTPNALLDRWIKNGQETREWLRFYDPPDKDARIRVMTWQLGTANQMAERFPAYWDDFRQTGIVEGAGRQQLIAHLDRKLNVLKGVRRGEPIPKIVGKSPLDVRFSLGSDDSDALELLVGVPEILRVGIKSHHTADLVGIAANLAVNKSLEIEPWDERLDAPAGGQVMEPAGDERYWEATGMRLVGGGWSNVTAFKVTASQPGYWHIELKLRIPGFETGNWPGMISVGPKAGG
jgi:hypothetical protein